MKIVKEEALQKEILPGRIIQSCVGKGAHFESTKMTMGFATYCEQAGEMLPHQHAEESVYIISADRGRVRYGPLSDDLPFSVQLESGMILHIPELEWHVFEYEKGGHVKIIFIYGQTENIRPEEITKLK